MAVARLPHTTKRKRPRRKSEPCKRKVTLAEFYAMPEGPPEEYDEGELICLAEPHGRHSDIQGALFMAVHTFVRKRKLGKAWLPINVELDPDHSYGPDLSYLSNEHLHRYHDDTGRIYGAPDLVVEIVSPRGGETRDRVRKFNVYRNAGVLWYWIVDSQSLTIEEYRWQQDGYLSAARVEPGEVFRPVVFPGLEINLQDLLGATPE